MASRLSIENDRLKVGQVKRVTSNNGNKIDSITLLLNESVEVLFAPNGNTLEFTVSCMWRMVRIIMQCPS